MKVKKNFLTIYKTKDWYQENYSETLKIYVLSEVKGIEVKMKVYGVIMAGGGGTRFWPVSRRKKPKQFLILIGKECLINETIDRLENIIEKENIFVVTSNMQKQTMKEITDGRINQENILSELISRNTGKISLGI